MKKIFILFISFVFISLNAQTIKRNNSKIYVGYTNMGISSEITSSNDHGFLVGISGMINIAYSPAYFEIGAEYSRVSASEEAYDSYYGHIKAEETLHATNVPVSILYKMGDMNFNFAPMAGFDFRTNWSFTLNDKDCTNLISKCQGCWHVGAYINYQQVSLGYKFTRSFNELVKHSDFCSYTHSITLGYCF